LSEQYDMPKTSASPLRSIEHVIVALRGHRVILDSDLAAMYGVQVRVLIQALKRNLQRFPTDFMFQLTLEEARQRSRSQTVILNAHESEMNGVLSLRPGRGRNQKYLPYAFTEQGVAMLSSVLNSPCAIRVNIEIVRAFVRLRQLLHGHEALARKVAELEERYDGQFRVVFDAIRELMVPAPERPMGFRGP
jgi:hypothetical protein